MELDGRRVLVTGASSGIGEATARVLAQRGAQVACLARSREKVEALAGEIGGVPVSADVSDEEGVRSEVDGTADALGGLDAVANIASVQLLAPFSKRRTEEWRLLDMVNVLGLCLVTHAALGHIRAATWLP